MGRKLHTEHEMHSLDCNVKNIIDNESTKEKNKYLYMCGIIRKILRIMWIVFNKMAGVWVYPFNRYEIEGTPCSLGHNSRYS